MKKNGDHSISSTLCVVGNMIRKCSQSGYSYNMVLTYFYELRTNAILAQDTYVISLYRAYFIHRDAILPRDA